MALPAAALPLLPAVALTLLSAYRDLSTLTIRQLTLETRDQESTICMLIWLERRGSVVVSTSAWHAAGRWFDSRTRHVSLLG